MTKERAAIIFSGDHEPVSINTVGGKAWNLDRLKRAGYSVPPWFVITSRAFDEMLKPHAAAVKVLLDRVAITEAASAEDASRRITEMIRGSRMENGLAAAISAAVESRFGLDSRLSVRSSVVGEDSTEHSFAGQMDSFLNIPASDVPDAVNKVWASAFSPRALLYRHRVGIGLDRITSGVIVQQMVGSVSSGVLFTRDPESRARECVISSGYGFCEGVVDNTVETDTYRVAWDSKEVVAEIGDKEVQVVAGVNGRGGTRLEAVPVSLRRRPVLEKGQIHRLRDVGVSLEKRFGPGQDIEWTFDADGALHILQARPIVFAVAGLTDHWVRVWDNSNIIESFPGLTLPLTFTFVQRAYEPVFRKAALGFLLFKNELRNRLHIFKNMLGLIDGRVYYNLLNWYEMLSFHPGFDRNRAAWDEMIGISQKIKLRENRLSPLNRSASILKAVLLLLSPGWTARRFSRHFEAVYAPYRDMDLSTANEERLIEIYETLTGAILGKWYLTIYNDFCAMTYYDLVKKLCRRWGLAEYPNLHNDLLCGVRGVESVAPVHSLLDLTERFRGCPRCIELMQEEDNAVIWETIQSDPAFANLKEALDRHLALFGDRGVEELKLERPSFRERPEGIVRLIRGYLSNGISVEQMTAREDAVRAGAERFLRKCLKNPFRRILFGFILSRARRSIAQRENMRFARSRLFGFARRLFRRVGELFASKDVLVTASDINYLTVDEVCGYVNGAAVSPDLKRIANARKKDYERFAEQHPPDRFTTTDLPYLNSFKMTESNDTGGRTLRGIGCSSGYATGTARVILDPDKTIPEGDHILITKSTDPGWVFLMIASKGIVVERGSVLSHTAIIGRELGIPTIVGAANATARIHDGAEIAIDGTTGDIRWK